MPAIFRQVPVAANSVNPNLVAGSAFEYPQAPQQVSLGVRASAPGIFLTVYAGARLIAEEFPATLGTEYPVIPDQMSLNFVITPNERLVISARNSTAGPLTCYLLADMQQIG